MLQASLVSWEAGRLRLRKRGGAPALPGEACNEHGHNAGQKDSVESAGASDGGDRRTQSLQLIEIEEVSADERAEAAADVGQRRRIPARQQQRDKSGAQGG